MWQYDNDIIWPENACSCNRPNCKGIKVELADRQMNFPVLFGVELKCDTSIFDNSRKSDTFIAKYKGRLFFAMKMKMTHIAIQVPYFTRSHFKQATFGKKDFYVIDTNKYILSVVFDNTEHTSISIDSFRWKDSPRQNLIISLNTSNNKTYFVDANKQFEVLMDRRAKGDTLFREKNIRPGLILHNDSKPYLHGLYLPQSDIVWDPSVANMLYY